MRHSWRSPITATGVLGPLTAAWTATPSEAGRFLRWLGAPRRWPVSFSDLTLAAASQLAALLLPCRSVGLI